MKIYFNNSKIIKKHWYGNETEDNFVEVDLLGAAEHETDNGFWKTYLIKLPSGEMKEVFRSELFFLPKKEGKE